jgi:hypothetical protein
LYNQLANSLSVWILFYHGCISFDNGDIANGQHITWHWQIDHSTPSEFWKYVGRQFAPQWQMFDTGAHASARNQLENDCRFLAEVNTIYNQNATHFETCDRQRNE